MSRRDFDYDILHAVAHRPWPLPSEPWVMTQTWHDLLFAHWPLDAAVMARALPAGVEVDCFDGQAWIAVVPFHMANVVPRGVPPWRWLSAFAELNVRTYVRVNGRPGVWFFSLDAASRAAVATARALARLPYFNAAMRIERDADSGWIHYRSRRTDARGAPAELAARFRPVGPIVAAPPGSLEHFLTERYCLFTATAAGRLYSVDVHHRPWPLQVAEAEIERNTMAAAAGIGLPPVPPLLHFAQRVDVVAWWRRRERG